MRSADRMRPLNRLRRTAATGLAALVVLTLAAISSPQDALAAPSPSPSASPSTAAGPSEAGKATFGIGPSNGAAADGRSFFNFLASPGASLTDNVVVSNFATTPLTLRVYAVDAVSGSDGTIAYAAAGQTSKDLASWASIGSVGDLGEITLPGGKSASLPVAVKVPANASPGDHVGAFVVSLTSKIKNDQGENVNLEQRVATRIYLRVSGPVVSTLGIDHLKASYASGFVINPLAHGDVKVSYRVHNTGNVLLGGTQSVSVSGWYGSVKTSVPAAIPQMLPGAYATVTTTVHNVPAAFRLTAKATVHPVPPPNAVDSKLSALTGVGGTWAVPWLVVFIVVILIGGIGYCVSRIVRRPQPQVVHSPRPKVFA